MQYKYRWRLVKVVIMLMCMSVAYLYWRAGGFIELTGTMLIPLRADEKEKGSISLIQLENGSKAGKYLEDTRYDEFSWPYKTDGYLICTAKNIEKGYYAVLKINRDEMEELVTSNKKIYCPLLSNNGEELIFTSEEDQKRSKFYLYKYNLKEKVLQKIYDEPVVGMSAPILFPDGTILLTAAKDVTTYENYSFIKSGSIRILRENGNAEELLEGTFPVWLEKGRSFFYFDDREKKIILYDISDATKKVIAKDIYISDLLTVSPNKKYLVFDEKVNINGKDRTSLLRVMTIDGWAKRDIKQYGKYGYFPRGYGVNWGNLL